jgi:hypothetical protein
MVAGPAVHRIAWRMLTAANSRSERTYFVRCGEICIITTLWQTVLAFCEIVVAPSTQARLTFHTTTKPRVEFFRAV